MNEDPISLSDSKWDDALAQSIDLVNLPTLLMVLVHLTGEDRWLSGPCHCSRIRGLEDNHAGGLPPEVQNEVRAALSAIRCWKAGMPAVLPAPAHGQPLR